MGFRSRVVTIPLVLDVRLFADDDTTYKRLSLDTPELEGLLPHADSLQLEWLLDQVADDQIDWNIEAYAGWDRDNELAAVTFFSGDQDTAGPQLSAITNFSATSYRRHVRLELRWRLHDSVTIPKEAKFSAILYVTTKGV